MRLFRTTVHLLVAIPDDQPDIAVFDQVSGVLTDMGVYVDATQPGGPLGIVDWGYTKFPPYPPDLSNLAGYGWEAVDTEGIVDDDGFVVTGAFLES